MFHFHRRNDPSERELAAFAVMLPLFFGAMGAVRYYAGSTKLAVLLWGLGAVLAPCVVLMPPARAWLYRGWMLITFPIAWTVSHVFLGFMYFGVATPIALVRRVFGHDSMSRSFDRSAPSYWMTRRTSNDRTRYFRQY